ncbi:MAG: glycosyltransferase family 39 protein, partial [Planctomycetota bacterium]
MSKRTSERTVKQQENQDLLKKVTDFWVLGGLLAILLAFTLGRDINRPFYGLHSWAEAHGPWHARVHLRCGLGYTKGFATKSVGYPCTENPTRYLDHPQLGSVMTLPYYAVFGVHEWSYRLLNIILTIIALLLLLKILRGLLDDKTALLAGLFFCLFPVIGYFGVNFWLYPFTLWAIWNYLVIIKAVRDGPEPAKLHKICLALALFMM